MRVRVPVSMLEHLESDTEPVEPRDASTVILVRAPASGDESGGVEAYMLRRQPTMKFAPGMYVFPGGRVDKADRVTEVPWAGAPPQYWAERFNCDVETARGLVCAAVRETFEESGVLLAGPDADSVVSDTSGAQWQEARSALENRSVAFAQFLQDRRLVLRADLLGAWAHWITPEFEPRRYDTRFFVAVLPTGQSVGELPGEADRGAWMPLRDVIASVDSGSTKMLPPTRRTCAEIRDVGVNEILGTSGARTIAPRMPRLVEVDGEAFLQTDLEPS